MGRLSHVIGIDDAPFGREHRGDVLVVGTVFAGLRLEGTLSTRVRRDGANATRRLAAMVGGSRFASHAQLILLQGIALAGFNVVDIHRLHDELAIPVMVVVRRRPNRAAVRRALLERVRGGARKWRLVERAGEMEPVGGLFVQRAGLDRAQATRVVRELAIHGNLPEPIRVAHIIAGGVVAGESRGRA